MSIYNTTLNIGSISRINGGLKPDTVFHSLTLSTPTLRYNGNMPRFTMIVE
jgi:hypothetical protein